METIDVLRIIWFFLIGLLLVGYSILDGFDLGIGSLFPLLAKNQDDKRKLFKSIGPFWDGNEVWLLTGGGALFAAFPHAYATVFSGFYLAFMILLFALIFRAVSIEFWYHDEERRRFWEWAFVIGSFLPSVLFGVALGNVIIGIPLNENFDFVGNFFTLLRPYPLILGILGLLMILLQGISYSILKTDGELKERSYRIARKIWIIFIIIFIISFIATLIWMPENLTKLLAWFFVALSLLFWILYGISLNKKKDGFCFLFSSLLFVSLWGIVGSIHFPYLVRANNVPEYSLTIYNASSSLLTLKVMFIIALIGMPFVIGYTIYVYNVFKGRD
ncbi:MAG: cytochrome d ubiquinol oxidase subunit II [Candidatus Hydrothermales bacterium]